MYKINNKTTNNLYGVEKENMTKLLGSHYVEQNLRKSTAPSGINIGTATAGNDGVVIDESGIRGYSSTLGQVFELPTDGSAPSFAAGTIAQTTFEIDADSILRTSAYVGDGTASSAGVLINNDGLFATEENQLLADANVQILNDGTATFKGTITAEDGQIGQWIIGSNTLSAGTGSAKVGMDSTGEYAFYAGADYGADAPFRVTPDGYLTAENVNIGTRHITIGSGDDINAAITEVATTGGTVTLKNGLYTLTEDILLASTVYLQGETTEGVILDFVDNSHGIKGVGANGYTTGTVSCVQGTTTVSGSGTSWSTEVAAGQRILLSESWYLITEVVSDTELTIELPYDWVTLSDATYAIATTIDDSEVRNMTILNADVGVYLQYTRNCGVATVNAAICGGALQVLDTANLTVSNFQAYGCSNGILLSNTHLTEMVTTGGQGCTGYGLKISNGSANNALSNNFLGGNGTYGLEVENSSNLSISGTILANTSHGIIVTGTNDITISDSAAEANGGSGIYIDTCTNVALNVAVTNYNTADGITVVNSTDIIATNGHSTMNGGYGVNIDGDSSYTGVIGRGFYSNVSGTINDLGTDTIISGTLGTGTMNLNNILPDQGAASGKYLYTDGTEVSWVDGSESLHGIQTLQTITFNNSTHVLAVATGSNAYWHQGESFTTTNSITCDIDDYETLTANTLYFFYFDDDSGTLKCADSPWNLKTQVPVATVYWNGSAGAVSYEAHNHTRDLDWHEWAHDTVGTRYEDGLTLTAPTTAADATLQIETGTLHDEDIDFATGQCTTMRGWYKADVDTYTFTDYDLPYLGTSGDPYWLDTDDYTLKSVDNAKFVCYWVYASTDQDRPIYVVPTHAADCYNTIALARAETAPSLSGFGLTPEIKLIYRFIYRGDGEFQESNDYRLTSPLPSGGSASTTAGAVSFSPSGNISSTSVQTAIEELDTEKLANVVEDLSPQLGANLDVNGFKLIANEGEGTIENYIELAEAGGTSTWSSGQFRFRNPDEDYGAQIYGINGSLGHVNGKGFQFTGGDGLVATDGTGGGISFIAGSGRGSGAGGAVEFYPGWNGAEDNSGDVIFWGLVGGAYLEMDSLTDDRTFTFPDKDGTFAMISDLPTGMTWNEITDASATMAVDNGYIANNGSLVTLTLPASAEVGKVVRVTGKGAGGWKIAQNANGIIHIGNADTTTGTDGYLASTHTRDSVELVCVVADNEWNVISSFGNITVV